MTFDHKWAPIGIACTVNDDVLPDTTPSDKQIQYADVSTVSYGLIGEAEKTTFDSAPSRARRLARPGDVVVSTVRTYLRAIAPVGEKESSYVFSTGFAVLRPREHLTNSRYLSYAMGSKPVIESIINTSNGVGYPAINPTDLIRVRIPLPPLDTQRRIAAFLDRETGQIDETITRIDRVVDLLEERVSSSIEHKLRSVDTKFSLRIGVLGIHTGPFGTQLGRNDYVTDGIPVINPTHIQNGIIAPDPSTSIREDKAQELSRHRFREGDIVLGRRGELGRCAVVENHSVGYVCGTGSLRVVPKPDVLDPYFLQLVISSSESRKFLEDTSVGSTMSNLSETTVLGLPIPAVTISEQKRIVEEVRHEKNHADVMISRAKDVKDLLVERRSALITAAVTGKVEV